PGLSGFLPLEEDRDAFMARLAMADLAETTLDAQYYIWDSDTTGRILGEHLLRAADHGVRVRVLIDDNYMTKVRESAMIALLDAQPESAIALLQHGRESGFPRDELHHRVQSRESSHAQQALHHRRRDWHRRWAQHCRRVFRGGDGTQLSRPRRDGGRPD